MSKKKSEHTYEQAYAELSRILQILQSQDVSLTEMTSHLRKAKSLLQFCEAQLLLTEQELASVMDEEE